MPFGVMSSVCSVLWCRASSSRKAVAVRCRSGSMFPSDTASGALPGFATSTGLTGFGATLFTTVVSAGEREDLPFPLHLVDHHAVHHRDIDDPADLRAVGIERRLPDVGAVSGFRLSEQRH